MAKIVSMHYSDMSFDFQDDGWFNATAGADQYGKRPVDWLSLDTTKEYIAALCEIVRSEKSSLLKIKRGGRGKSDATWMHPKLAVPFARWLDIKFSIWCDAQIDQLIRRQDDWKKLRHEAASSHKVMNAVMLLQRQQQGKETKPHHFSNEARLINWALTHEFKALDRNALPEPELDLLAKLEERNTVLIGCGLTYDERKLALERFSEDYRQPKGLEAAA